MHPDHEAMERRREREKRTGEAAFAGVIGSAPIFFQVEVPGNGHSNEVQLIAGLERLTDIAIDWSKPDAGECAARAAAWYFARYGKPNTRLGQTE